MNIDLKERPSLVSPAVEPRTDHGVAIVSADRGHVWVGRVVTEGAWCVISSASTVRRWGTTKGLGQLASDGPTGETVLDAEFAEVRVPMRAVIAVRPCKEESWKL